MSIVLKKKYQVRSKTKLSMHKGTMCASLVPCCLRERRYLVLKTKIRSKSEICYKRVVCVLCTLVYVDERRCTSVCNLGAFWSKKILSMLKNEKSRCKL